MRFHELAATTSLLALLASIAAAEAAEPFAMQAEDVPSTATPFQMLASDLVYAGEDRALDARITRNDGERVTFTDDASAANAVIVVNEGGAARFAARSAAESAVITNNAATVFEDTASAGSARIVNNGSGSLAFTGQSSAADASIENSGTVRFSDRSSAGTASLANNEAGTIAFADDATAGSGGLLNNSGALRFEGHAQAGERFVTNNRMGRISFTGQSSAGSSVTANSGAVDFAGQATLADGEIIGNDGSSIRFAEDSTAARGRIAHAGTLSFAERADAGEAFILTQTGGATLFRDRASGSLAEMEIQDGAMIDFSGLSSGATSIGSLLGSGGQVFLGGIELTVGGNGLETTFGGLSDGGIAGGQGGSLVKLGDQTLRLDGTNSYTGPTRIEAGTLQAASANAFAPLSAITLAEGARLDLAGSDQTIGSLAGRGVVDLAVNTLTLGGDGRSTEFAGTFAGVGGFAKVGDGIFHVSADSAISGPTSVLAGTLVLDGNLSLAPVEVSGSGRIAGAGTAGSLTISTGGTLVADGPALSVEGDLALGAGAFHSVLLSDTLEPIAVGGAATIGAGSLLQVAAADSFEPFRAYTLIAASGGVSGAYGGVQSHFAFLDPVLRYDPAQVSLTLERNAVRFADVTRTPNDRAAAGALETLAPGNALYSSLLRLNAADASLAFAQLSGEGHASLGTGLIEDSHHIRRLANERMRVRSPYPGDGVGAWAAGFGSWGENASKGDAISLDRDLGGVLAGTDVLLENAARFGLLAGYSRSDYTLDSGDFSAEIDSLHAGVYAGTQIAGLALRTGAAYSWHDVATGRSVAFPGFADTLSASYHASTAQVFGEASHAVAFGPAVVEPFAGLAYVRLDIDPATETGGAAALTLSGRAADTTFSTLGVRAASRLYVGGLDVTARGLIGWRHAFSHRLPDAALAFAGSEAFKVAGVPLAQDAALVELGFDIAFWPSATLGIDYVGQFGDGATSNGVNASLSYRF